MKIIVVTNNLSVKRSLQKHKLEIVFVDGPAQLALKTARDMILDGWHLAADPLAGYYIRYNPYHTVFLSDENLSSTSEDILILEHAICHLDDPRRPAAEDVPEIRADYQILDHSLATNTAESLCKYLSV